MSEKEKLNAMRKTFSGESVTDLKDEIILLKQKVADLEQSNKDRQQENFRLKKCEIALKWIAFSMDRNSNNKSNTLQPKTFYNGRIATRY